MSVEHWSSQAEPVEVEEWLHAECAASSAVQSPSCPWYECFMHSAVHLTPEFCLLSAGVVQPCFRVLWNPFISMA